MKTNLFNRLIVFITCKLKRKSTVIEFVGDLVLESLQITYKEWIKKSELIYIHTDMSQLKMYENYDNFTINGIFSFSNLNNKTETQQIIFPFANETNSIDSIRIINLNTLSDQCFTKLKKVRYFLK